MNARSPYNRPVSRWSRTLAGLLSALIMLETTELAWEMLRGGTLPWPFFQTLMFMTIAGLALALCGSVALTGRPPRFWTRIEVHSAARNDPGAPFWRRSWQRRSRRLQRAGLVVLGSAAVGYAILTTVGASARSHASRKLQLLVLVWCLALGVVGAVIAWWREAGAPTRGQPDSPP